jgi:hypothetical protein
VLTNVFTAAETRRGQVTVSGERLGFLGVAAFFGAPAGWPRAGMSLILESNNG